MVVRLVGFAASGLWAIVARPGGPLLSQAGQAGTDISGALVPLLAGSPFGVCLVLVLFGWLAPKSTVERLADALADVKSQRDALAAQQAEVIPVLVTVQTTMIPTLDRSQQALASATREIEQLRGEVRRLGDLISAGRGGG